VNYWATWCAPCREEIPLLVKMQAQYAASGLQVVGIATDETSTKDVKHYLTTMVVNYPMLMGNEDVDRMVAGFGGNLIGLPFSLLLDRDGHVIKLSAGQLDPKDTDLMIRTALAQKPGASGAAPAAGTGSKPATTATSGK